VAFAEQADEIRLCLAARSDAALRTWTARFGLEGALVVEAL